MMFSLFRVFGLLDLVFNSPHKAADIPVADMEVGGKPDSISPLAYKYIFFRQLSHKITGIPLRQTGSEHMRGAQGFLRQIKTQP